MQYKCMYFNRPISTPGKFFNNLLSRDRKMIHHCANTISSDMRYTFDARRFAKRFNK